MDLIYLFPRELWHTAQPILIYVLCTIQYVFVLVIRYFSLSTVSTIHFSTTMSVIDVLYTHTHTHTHIHHIRLRERSSVRHIISYGVTTPADTTICFFGLVHSLKIHAFRFTLPDHQCPCNPSEISWTIRLLYCNQLHLSNS